MKSKYIIFGTLFLLIITATITNPKKEDHSDSICNSFIDKEKLMEANGFELIALSISKKAFEEIVYINNYVIFSVGKIKYNGIEKKVSFGIFGNVFLLVNRSEWDNLGNNLNEDRKVSENTSEINAEKSSIITDYKDDTEDNAKTSEKIYGDFNGDGSFEYAFRVLTKKGKKGVWDKYDPIPDKFEIRFSDKEINPIKGDFNWCTLVNEGDLNNDGSDEITLVIEPDNGSINWGQTYTFKKGKWYNLIDAFSVFIDAFDRDACINPQDLVENENGIVYYYEYNADGDLEPNGGFSVNSKGKKIFAKKIKAFKVNNVGNKTEENVKDEPVIEKPKVSKNANDALSSLLGNNGEINGNYNGGNGTGSGSGTGGSSGFSLGSRKTISKPQPDYPCKEQGRVVVQVSVDRNGNTIDANPGVQGTTNTARCLMEAAKIAAMNTKWEPDENAPEKQVGKMTYTFSLN